MPLRRPWVWIGLVLGPAAIGARRGSRTSVTQGSAPSPPTSPRPRGPRSARFLSWPPAPSAPTPLDPAEVLPSRSSSPASWGSGSPAGPPGRQPAGAAVPGCLAPPAGRARCSFSSFRTPRVHLFPILPAARPRLCAGFTLLASRSSRAVDGRRSSRPGWSRSARVAVAVCSSGGIRRSLTRDRQRVCSPERGRPSRRRPSRARPSRTSAATTGRPRTLCSTTRKGAAPPSPSAREAVEAARRTIPAGSRW